MTNNTTAATATLAEQLLKTFSGQCDNGLPLRTQLINWLTQHGIDFVLNVVASILILVVGAFLIRLFVAAIGKAIERRGTRTLFAHIICSAVSKLCWAILIVIILGKLGINIAPIVTGLGVTGFIFGFAFQESLGNLAAGLMIALNEPFKIGDYVIVAGFEGSVRRMDTMATQIVTPDNKKIVIANKTAWNSPITNFTALGHRRVNFTVGIGYACDIAKAIRIALETLPTVPGVLTNPAPQVTVASLDDSQVTLNIMPWAKNPNYSAVSSHAKSAIKAAFEKNGIDIPFPQLTVHVDRPQVTQTFSPSVSV